MNHVRWVLGLALLVTVSAAGPVRATDIDINGTNGWYNYYTPGAPNYTTDTFVTGVSPHSGNRSLYYGPVQDDPRRGATVNFTAINTGVVDLSFWVYQPATSAGAWGFRTTDIWNVFYSNVGSWFGWSSNGNISQVLPADQWNNIHLVYDFDNWLITNPANGTTQPMVAGTSAFSRIRFLVQDAFNGTPYTGPIYFDDFEVKHDNVTIWSDNFDTATWPGYIPGDFNKDGQVGPEDFGILKDQFGISGLAHGQHDSWTLGDANDDGQIGPEDFGLLKDNFGTSGGPTGAYPLSNVPEPATLALLALAGLAIRRKHS